MVGLNVLSMFFLLGHHSKSPSWCITLFPSFHEFSAYGRSISVWNLDIAIHCYGQHGARAGWGELDWVAVGCQVSESTWILGSKSIGGKKMGVAKNKGIHFSRHPEFHSCNGCQVLQDQSLYFSPGRITQEHPLPLGDVRCRKKL